MIDFTTVAAELRGATVRVTDARARGAASGILWRDPRTVVTNAHVVRSSRASVEFEVTRGPKGLQAANVTAG